MQYACKDIRRRALGKVTKGKRLQLSSLLAVGSLPTQVALLKIPGLFLQFCLYYTIPSIYNQLNYIYLVNFHTFSPFSFPGFRSQLSSAQYFLPWNDNMADTTKRCYHSLFKYSLLSISAICLLLRSSCFPTVGGRESCKLV